ncbi:glycosyltransferase family 4 protein [Sphingomonas sp. R-74633]|uniref:glycosyltransferase family 4 protein n=1 Tax=Sphingomonas sp. R-74633 TaxID=2751188 RepID=UPI0015D38CBD|nr:glycosyltransferase family 4 protein [Sphingomonas sp. R-74633]NYT39238.1 glycosyltransferase family 4 protein [Sphingomonas sp. R-74633]
MRLLILSQYFWPENFRVNDLAHELIARGHEVIVLTGQPNYPDGHIFPDYRADPKRFAEFEGAPVFRVPVVPRGRRSLQLIANYLSFVVSGWAFGPRKLRGREFDAIFVFQTSPITSALPALWLRWRRGTPVLMWVLDLWPDTLSAVGVVKSPRALRAVGALVRFIYRRCDRILVQSRAFFDNVERYAGGTEKVRYFPGWAEAMFDADGAAEALAPELDPYADDFKILFAGNIGQAQDFPAIIAAADTLRDTPALRWIVVGDGRAAEDAKADVARRGLEDKVVFLGRFPLERMPSFFNGADCLLVSLKNDPIWSMTIPGKVQSYLASGRPLLGMLDGEGANVIRESGAGVVGPASDPVALAENVRALMRLSPEERRHQGESGRRYCAQEFNRTVLVDRLERWIEALGEGRHGVR